MLKIALLAEDFLKWRAIIEHFGKIGWKVSTFDTFDVDVVKCMRPDLLLIDLTPPISSGIEFFCRVKEECSTVEAIFTSSFATLPTAVEAMKTGALDFLSHPISSDNLVFRIKEFENRLPQFREGGNDIQSFHQVLGHSPKMKDVFQRAAKVSKFDTIVMVMGETGTGKEVLARSIHLERAPEKPFAAVHLGNIPEELAEAELFGFEKGAFTSAYKSKPGKFEIVEDGTIFLDDIDDASPRIQTKLLRVLQEKEFERVGGIKTLKARSRIIISAKPAIYQKVQNGEFREDLFYRINVVPIKLPALRERKEDIPLLIDHFIRKYSTKFNKKSHSISETAIEHLAAYDFPGNIRELEHIIERMVCFSKTGSIKDSDVKNEFSERFHKDVQLNCGDCLDKMDTLSYKLYDIIEQISKKYIAWAWKKSGENAFQASKLLGIPRTSLLVKLKKYDLK